MQGEAGLTTALWAALGGEREMPADLEVRDRDAWLGGPLAVDELAVAAVSAALLGAAELARARYGSRPEIELSAEHVALSFRSERHTLLDGQPTPAGFAPMSRLVRCRGEGWARTHANYAHHAAALGAALGIPTAGDAREQVERLQAAAAARDAFELENAVVAAGGCAAALRTQAQWHSHPAGAALDRAPLIVRAQELATRAPRPFAEHGELPCTGVRVLDLTRVIAGPVAGRTLAALGADVLRVDPPRLAELPEQHLDTGPGKRSATLDLADAERRETLLSAADVVLAGYRPGALRRYGLTRHALAERHPHLVQVWLSAWGETGPWCARRGFDSLVQVACGIADIYATDDGTPGVLPAQALDHASGHLMAAVALRGLAARVREEPVAPCSLALGRTAAVLLGAPRPQASATDATGTANPDRYRVTLDRVTLIRPPGTLAGVPLSWVHGPHPLGSDPPVWGSVLGAL